MEERETACRVVRQLQKISPDFDIRMSIGGYGLIAILKNSTGSGKQQGKTILLRADMDALPVEEETDVDYASKKTMKDEDGTVKPVMHACGHDLHVSACATNIPVTFQGKADDMSHDRSQQLLQLQKHLSLYEISGAGQ